MHEFILIASVHFLALLSPGQDFFLLVRASLRHGFGEGARVSLGIAAANALWILLALWGVEQIKDLAIVLKVMKFLGAAYLIWLGWNFLKARPRDLACSAAAPAAGPSALLLGLLSGLSNPKNGLFYAGLFSAGIDPAPPAEVRLLYGGWMVFAVLAWDLAISAWLAHPRQQRWLGRWQWRIERASGCVLMGIGGTMLMR